MRRLCVRLCSEPGPRRRHRLGGREPKTRTWHQAHRSAPPRDRDVDRRLSGSRTTRCPSRMVRLAVSRAPSRFGGEASSIRRQVPALTLGTANRRVRPTVGTRSHRTVFAIRGNAQRLITARAPASFMSWLEQQVHRNICRATSGGLSAIERILSADSVEDGLWHRIV
jgi:hypothetical protein